LHLRDLRESREEAGDEVRLGEWDGWVGDDEGDAAVVLDEQRGKSKEGY